MDPGQNLTALAFLVNLALNSSFESLMYLLPSRAILEEDDGRDLIAAISQATEIPSLTLTYGTSVTLKDFISSECLAIVAFKSQIPRTVFETLKSVFHLMRTTKMVFLLDADSSDDAFLHGIFTTSWDEKFLNVVAIFEDFTRTQLLYGFSPYPDFHVIVLPPGANRVFPNKMLDHRGAPFRVFSDQIAPRSMVHVHRDGRIELLGFVGHLVTAFAKKHNAKLTYPIEHVYRRSQFFGGLRLLVFNETVEILVSLTFMNVSCELYSYTVEHTAWCIMLPVEANIPTPMFYVIIVDASVVGLIYAACLAISLILTAGERLFDRRRDIRVMDVLLHQDCLRGLLSQSFNIFKSTSHTLMLSYMIVSLLGVYFTTWYIAYLQTYLTHPPTERRIESVKDLFVSRFHILMYWLEYENSERVQERPFDFNIRQMGNYVEYLEHMDAMDPKYAYFVPLFKWDVLRGQQRLFAKPLFRITDICDMRGTQMGFALHENSPFRDTLNRVILQVQESGLLQLWMDNGFAELVQLKRMNFSDWSGYTSAFKQLTVTDLCWVFLVFLAVHLGSCAVFLGEVALPRRI